MTPRHLSLAPRAASRQRGLTLIEFMVSIVLGMIMVAALATLIADQSGNRAEVERSGRMIENGRYAVRALADDMQMAGYWGELASTAVFSGTLPDPCALTATDIDAAMPLHVQAYDYPSASTTPGYNGTGTAPTFTCIGNVKPGTDIVVVRRADPDSSSLETAGVPDLTKISNSTNAGTVLLQTGLISTTQNFSYSLKAASTSSGTNATYFPLVRKDLATLATIRKVVVHIYYVSSCSVEVGGSCTGADNGNPIPTLKMAELSTSSGAPAWNKVTLAEGIENLQVDFGVDSDADGSPNGADLAPGGIAAASWQDAMSAKIFLLARSNEVSPGYSDATTGKKYAMGTAGTTAPVANTDHYKRHVFVQSVRFVNPSARRSS